MQAGVMEREHPAIESQQFDYDVRRYNDTVTWLAEVLPGHMRTPFEYTFDGRELYAEDGSAMGEVFDDSIKKSEKLTGNLRFEYRRNLIEKEEYRDMIAMMRDELPNTMVVESDFPPELMEATEDIGGYNAKRKPTMLRVITKTPQGTLMMYSQTLDGSNRQALEAIREHLGFDTEDGELLGQRMHLELGPHEQEFLIDELTGVYDRSLQQQFGGEWYAGRRDAKRVNTYDFVRQQSDLLNAYLASTSRFMGGEADYNLAAAMKQRFEQGFVPQAYVKEVSYDGLPVAAHAQAMAEMSGAGRIARMRGETFSGCGATISSNNRNELETDPITEQLRQAGYGNLLEEEAEANSEKSEKLVWKNGVCRIENCPTRPGETKVAQCSICKLCQGWFDRGKDPSKVYKPATTSFRSIIGFNFGKNEAEKIEDE